MFADQLWPNLALFAAGQAAAWYYLHTGRTRIGAASTVLLWVLADWFLVAKFVYRVDAVDLRLPLVALQVTALLTVAALLFAQWRRRWSKAALRRGEEFAVGTAAYLRGELDGASTVFRRLVRTDPWDAAAWVALGNAQARAGEARRARRSYRRALGVDTGKVYGEFVRHRLALLAQGAAADAAPVAVSASPPVEATTG